MSADSPNLVSANSPMHLADDRRRACSSDSSSWPEICFGKCCRTEKALAGHWGWGMRESAIWLICARRRDPQAQLRDRRRVRSMRSPSVNILPIIDRRYRRTIELVYGFLGGDVAIIDDQGVSKLDLGRCIQSLGSGHSVAAPIALAPILTIQSTEREGRWVKTTFNRMHGVIPPFNLVGQFTGSIRGRDLTYVLQR